MLCVNAEVLLRIHRLLTTDYNIDFHNQLFTCMELGT